MSSFGQIDGVDVPVLSIAGPGGLAARLIPWGARLIGLDVPDRNGRLGDIVLGHDRPSDYQALRTYFGATCGRYANRIAGGRFTLDSRAVQLDLNEGANHLHGGAQGFDTKIWQVIETAPGAVTFALTSPDGDMGYPGELTVRTRYAFEPDGRFTITMSATTTAPTVVNLVNHAYFNLAGRGDVLDHVMQVPAQAYVAVRPDLIPDGPPRPVAGTAFDFRQATPLRTALARDPAMASGYDHNWCIDPSDQALRPVVRLVDPASGRGMDLQSTEPGVQIYTCGMMPPGVPAKGGGTYGTFAGLTLETQKYPDSPNRPDFPPARLDPGQTYHHWMEFAFFTA